jgi:tetratricopeptide (TPR) repeat protein
MTRIITTLGLMPVLAARSALEVYGQAVSRAAGVEKTRLYLMAGDYRRALELCEQAIQEMPSVENYLHLTYVYQAIEAYLAQLSQDQSWMAVEQLYLNLAYRHTEDLIDPGVFSASLGGLSSRDRRTVQTEAEAELSGVSAKWIHEPQLMSQDEQDRARCRIGVEYPSPIVDHRQARQEYLDLGKQPVAP